MVLARVPLEVWHHDAVHAARPKNPPDLSQEPRHGTAVEVLEHMRVVDGVDAPFRSRDALFEVVDQDVIHPEEKSPSFALQYERRQAPADWGTPQPRVDGPIDVRDHRARLGPAP